MKLGAIITCYNRPLYLEQCLISVKNADLSKLDVLLIIDDCSTDPETRRLIDDFDLEDIELIKCYSKENRSIKGSLLFGYDVLFNTCDVVINLDADAIVTKDAFNRLIELHKRFPQNICTGFNCLTKNKNGTERHVVIDRGEGYNVKKSVGGINMIFSHGTYLGVVRNALLKSQKENLNWDHQACLSSYNGYGRGIICMEPSCVQHIGIDSSMGHSTGGEPPDVADDFDWQPFPILPAKFKSNKPIEDLHKYTELYNREIKNRKIKLPNVTLICADGFNVERCIHAANLSCRDIEFGAVKILSHLPSEDPRVIKIRELKTKKDYSQFVLKEMINYVHTDYMLLFQYDGFVVNAKAWDKEFLNWDMVGAPWKFKKTKRTCNGGFSLRSKRMCELIRDDGEIYLRNDDIITNYAEDHVLFHIYREYLETGYGIRIAPEEVCDKFSIEAWGIPENKYSGQFGFHGFGVDFNNADLPYVPYKLPNKEIL